MIKKILVSIFILLALTVSMNKVRAQCAMCKRTAETDFETKNKQSSAKSLNSGILYLLSVPYLIGAVGAIAWYKNRRKEN